MTSPTGPDTSGGGGGTGPKSPIKTLRNLFLVVGAVAVAIAESLSGRTA